MTSYKKILLTLCAGFMIPAAAFAWSGTEHRLMAYIAQEHLLPQTQTFLDRYLDQSIIGYASWMDRYRKSPGYEHTDSHHMVTIDENGRIAPKDQSEGYAAHALREAVDILKNYKNYNDSTVYINIVYVIHLVPEVHCPSHYYFHDLGGIDGARKRDFQTVIIGGKKQSYHALWDHSVSELNRGLNYDQYLQKFDTMTPEQQKAVSDGTVEDWMLDVASKVHVIYDWAAPGDELESDFLERHRSLPEGMMAVAGYRLARLLNDLFSQEQ